MGSSPPPKPFTIAIVGGGIGGVALALTLATQNVPFHIYESAPSFGEIGAGVTFGPNVIRAIRGISPHMLRAYAKHATSNTVPGTADTFLTYRKGYRAKNEMGSGDEEEEYAKWTPERLFDLVNRVQEFDGMEFPVRCSVHRAHLLDELVRLLPEGSASFSKKMISYHEPETPTGDVIVAFSDGTTATASAVVACDGIRSASRQYLHGPTAQASYAGFYGYRAMAPREEFERLLGKDLAATGNHYLCWNGYTIAYPVDHGSALNMFATCAKPDSKWDDKEWKVPSHKDELLADLEGWHPGVLELLVKHGSGEKWAMFHSPHDQPYFRDKVCLLGDAAHATTPHLGAGAGMAIEDAFILGRLLGHARRGEDLARVFEVYDRVRRPRTQEVIRESKANVARYLAISGAKGEELEELKRESHEVFGKIFDFDLEGSLEEALGFLDETLGAKAAVAAVEKSLVHRSSKRSSLMARFTSLFRNSLDDGAKTNGVVGA